MHRIDTPTAQKDKFGAGKNGFTRGNPQTAVPATDLDDDYFDSIQEEIAGLVEAGGLTLDKADRGQVLKALKLLFAANTDSLGALASLVGAANKLPYFTGPKAAALADLTAFAREILAQTDAAGVLSKLGVSSHGQLLNVQTFSTSGTYTKTPGTNFVIVKQIGGGGASGAISATSSNQNSITCPGANGVYAEAKFTSGFDGVSVTVGAGGQPRLGNGFDGGQTSFGSLLVCPGGTGSLVGNPTTAPGYTSPQNGTSAPTVDPSGTLLASDYGSYLQPALIAGLGVATNYASWKLTPFDRKGMGGNGRLNGLNGVQQQGVAGNDGLCQVWEYS